MKRPSLEGAVGTMKRHPIVSGVCALVVGAISALGLDVATNPFPAPPASLAISRVADLFGSADTDGGKEFAPDIEGIRADIAGTLNEDLPDEIRVLTVAVGEVPESFVDGGGSAREGEDFLFTSVEVVYRDEDGGERTVVIDPMGGPDSEYFKTKWLYPDSFNFIPGAFEALNDGMLRADKIVATHGHWDHVRGIVESPDFLELVKKTYFTSAQVEHLTTTYGGWTEEQVSHIPKENIIESTGAEPWQKIDEGIYRIPTAGHTPDHDIMLVMTSDGREHLLAGDVAHKAHTIGRAIGPRLINAASGVDGAALQGQSTWLGQVLDGTAFNGAGDVDVIVAHDPESLAASQASGGIKEWWHRGLVVGQTY